MAMPRGLSLVMTLSIAMQVTAFVGARAQGPIRGLTARSFPQTNLPQVWPGQPAHRAQSGAVIRGAAIGAAVGAGLETLLVVILTQPGRGFQFVPVLSGAVIGAAIGALVGLVTQ